MEEKEERNINYVRMHGCGDVMIGQHERSVHEVLPALLWDKGDAHFTFFFTITLNQIVN